MIDLWDLKTYTTDIMKVLESGRQTIAGFHEREHELRNAPPQKTQIQRLLSHIPENEFEDRLNDLRDELGHLLSSKVVRGFHYCRLIDAEADGFLTNGIILTSTDFLRQRVDRLVELDHLTRAQGDKIVNQTALDRPAEFGHRVGFNLTATPIQTDSSFVDLLLRYWGGESAYWVFQEVDEDLLTHLETVGRPRIIEVAVPVEALEYGETGAGMASDLVNVYANSIGIPQTVRRDLRLKATLPPTSILKVVTQGESDFDNFAHSYPATYEATAED